MRKLDPFYWFDRAWYALFGKPRNLVERAFYELFQLVYALLIAYIVYLLLGFLLHTPKPAVIVASQSMEPTLYPGDIAVVMGVPFFSIRAPEVHVSYPVGRKTLEQLGWRIEREGLRAVALIVDNKRIPLEKNGDIVVYFNDVLHKDIVHRAVLKIVAPDGNFLLTKGDNDATNPTLDQDCELGCAYPFPIPYQNVYGRVIFVIPRIGIVKLILFGA